MPDTLLSTYPDAEGRFDESFEAPRRPRAHWRRLFSELTQTSAEDIRARLAAAERQIRDSGVTYNVYADPKGLDRPWELDVLPLIIAPDEWQRIETGIAQRASLFNAILGDLYGRQELLRRGIIHAPGNVSQGGLLHPAHGRHPAGDGYLAPAKNSDLVPAA